MMRNLLLKVFSLAVAVLLFLFVRSEGNTSVVEITVPVELRNPPTGQVITGPREHQARVTLRGPTALVARIASTPPSFKVTLPDEETQHFIVTLRADMLSLPPYVKVQRIEPAQVEFRLDRLVSKSLTVRVPRVGEVQPGMRIDAIAVAPPSAVIKGPESEISRLQSLETSPLDLRELRGDFERALSIRLPGELSEVTPATVQVTGKVQNIEKRATLKNLTVEVRSSGGAADFSLDPQSVSVDFVGTLPKMELLTPEEVVPYVRVRATTLEGAVLAVGVDLPLGVRLISVDPPEVRVVRSTPSAVKQPNVPGKKK